MQGDSGLALRREPEGVAARWRQKSALPFDLCKWRLFAV